MPRLNLLDDLGLRDDDPSHAVKQVDENGDISWGTPLSTARPPKKSTERSNIQPATNKPETILTPQNIKKSTVPQKDKYYYLNESARPLHDLTGMLLTFY